jgi:hypothetical protein
VRYNARIRRFYERKPATTNAMAAIKAAVFESMP